MEAQTDDQRRTKQDATIDDDERRSDRASSSEAGRRDAGDDGHCYAATLLLKLKYDREHFDEIDWDQLRHGGF